MSDVDFIGAHLVPSPEQLLRLQRVAAGTEPADLALRGGTVLALHGREMLRRDVLICGPYIAAVTPPGRLAAAAEIDAEGCWVSPGFIDTHLHIEYTLLTPGELARLVVPRGTTTVLADPNCLANVLGPSGMDIAGRTGTPLRIFRQVSHKVPRSPELELVGGEVAGRGGTATFGNDDVLPGSCRGTVRLHPDIGPESFRVEVPSAEVHDAGTRTTTEGSDAGGAVGGHSEAAGAPPATVPGPPARSGTANTSDLVAVVRAMEMHDGYFKRAFEAELAIADGSVAADPSADVAKIAVVDRHHASHTLAMGFVRGFGLRSGAIGITTNCENQNLVVLGTSDGDLAHAARALETLDGGYVVVAGGEVLASLPLPHTRRNLTGSPPERTGTRSVRFERRFLEGEGDLDLA